MIAVCLLTCGREAYTRETLKSFTGHNPRAAERFMLLHADDGSQSDANELVARWHGFQTVHRSLARTGGVPALRAMWQEAARCGADRILHLENDWLWCGPVPEIEHDCVRLYGVEKGRGHGLAELAGTIHLGTREPVTWSPHSPGWEIATIHWGGPPSITRTELLLPAIKGADKIGTIARQLSVSTVRPVENLVWHIGRVTTSKAPC